jgi:hypothetical protein
MRNLGAAVGVEAISAYHHIDDRAALMDGVAETTPAVLPVVTEEQQSVDA